MNSLQEFFALLWLCWRLIWQLLLFALQLFWAKLNKEQILYAGLSLLIFLLCLLNLHLIQLKQTPQSIEDNKIDNSINFQNRALVVYSEAELAQQIVFYQQLVDRGVVSRDLYLNLALLYQAVDQSELAQQYLTQARFLDPNNPLFQNQAEN